MIKTNETPIEEYLLTSDSKAVRILLWLLKNRDKENVIHATIDLIAEECGTTKITVNRVFKRLYKDEFLTKIRNSKYQLKRV